ncbi:MAG: phospholipase D-like domain-containing protein [Raineya sp.]|jgi:hypothetical protein|nr:phospholipase D-like domain-containing protein [Raineya sp.]
MDIIRILKLAEEIKNFPLHKCSPSDDPDKCTAALYGFRDITTLFINHIHLLNDNFINEKIQIINTKPDLITEAYDLKSELCFIIDYIEENKYNFELTKKIVITKEQSNTIYGYIYDALFSISANILPNHCEGLGLEKGTVDEAFKSKKNYIIARIGHLQPNDIYSLAKKIRSKSDELDDYLKKIENSIPTNIISKFDDIEQTIVEEIQKAEFLIWIAVAWFTNGTILESLQIKQREGLNIQLILNDDDNNSRLKPHIQENFEAYFVPTNMPLLHHKFCIIDLKKMITGSYNWTYKANFNNENIILINDISTVRDFSMRFIEIKKELLF